jgi:hypothetical protein
VIQGLANQLDEKFELLRKFRRIAELKAAHIEAGGTDNWPFYSFEDWDDPELLVPHFSHAANAYYGRLEVDYLDIDHSEGLERLPRIYVGDIIDWDAYFHGGMSNSTDALTRRVEKNNVRENYLKDRPIDPGAGTGAQRTRHDFSSGWLVLYPSRDLSSISPMMWICSGDGQVESNELNVRQLLRLQACDCITDEVSNAYEHIESLVADGELLRQWTHTATELDTVSFLVKAEADAQRKKNLDTMFDELWKEED